MNNKAHLRPDDYDRYIDDINIWQKLANAIITSAAKEYINLSVAYYKNKSVSLYSINRVKSFFYSSSFMLYTKIDPHRLIADLDREIERRLNNG